MALVDMRDMLDHAYSNGYAVGAFDLVSLDFLEGIMDAAERCRAPVILSLAESHFDYFDFELMMPAVEAAARRASVPVAIHLDHGASLESAVRAINLGCNGVMVDASGRQVCINAEQQSSFTGLVKGVKEAIGTEVEHCMRLWGSAGRAEEVLAQCTPWAPIEHLIIYNVKGLDERGVEAMMSEGRRVLATVPGVREVMTGRAVKQDAAYRYTW